MRNRVFIKNPDDAIIVRPIGYMNFNIRGTVHCSTCGETRSVKYYMIKNDKIHFLCNECALTRDLSLRYYYNSIKHKTEDDSEPSFTEDNYKPSFAVRLYRASNNHDIAEMRYLGGISKRVDLTVNGYSFLKEVNGYTLFYDEREEYLKSNMIPVEQLSKAIIVIIEYEKDLTPIARIIEPGVSLIKYFKFNYVDDFNEYYAEGLIDRIDSLPDDEKKTVYFIDLREKAPFDDFIQ